MIHLDLSGKEVEILANTLAQDCADLSYEISNTDSQDFREQLKARRDALARIVDTLTLNRRTA